MSHPLPAVQPRLVELAALAERRLDLGHPRREVLLDALVAATSSGQGLPRCFDNLTPQMREVLLVVYASGRVRLGAIAKATGKSRAAIQSIAHRLSEYRVLRRVERGVYEMNQRPPTMEGLRTTGDRRRVLRYIERVGETTLAAAAAALNRHPSTTSRALHALALAGLVDYPRRGVYRAKPRTVDERAA